MICPSWLPPILSLNGKWEDALNTLYSIFVNDFKIGKPTFNSLMVWWDNRILPGDCYEEGFWHLISKIDRESKERVPDYPRAKRLPWCAPTILNATSTALKVWNYEESSGKIRVYIWLESEDYIVVLEKAVKRFGKRTGQVYFLITAFNAEGESTKRNLKRKYDNRIP